VGELTGPDVVDLATAVAAELNEQVRRTARCGAGNTGAAAALLLVRAGRALAVHLGDSRIYLTRGGRLRRLTKDHALPAGQLTRFVGMNGVVRPGVSLHDLEAGDRMLLCTDGLTGGVDDYRVGALLATSSDVHVACRSLVDAARAGGSADDISMIAVEYGAREGWPSRG
jgi:protein phosphatase